MSQTEVQIPQSYESWKSPITGQCRETLSSEFIDARLKALKNPQDPSTKRFKEAYGEDYLKTVISWFERAKNDLV